MLPKFNELIVAAYDHAADCKRRADVATDPTVKNEFLHLAERWMVLARSYEFIENSARFLLSSLQPAKRDSANDAASSPQGPEA